MLLCLTKKVWSAENFVGYFPFNIIGFRVMTPQGLVGGYRLFSGKFWLRLKPFYLDGGMFYSKALGSAYQTALCYGPEDHMV